MRKDDFLDRMDKYLGIFCGMVFWLLLLFLLWSLAGCTQYRYIEVPTYHSVDSTKMIYRTDSVYLHDSIYTNVETHGDTVFLTKYVTKYKYKEIVRTDTLLSVRVDSVQVPTPIETKAEYTMPRWQRFFFRIGLAVSFCALCYIVYWLIKKWR